jgi:hypothetical protein
MQFRLVIVLISSGLIALGASRAWAQVPAAPEMRIAILGAPDQAIAWTDEALEHLKDLGFNEVQLNLAWTTPMLPKRARVRSTKASRAFKGRDMSPSHVGLF